MGMGGARRALGVGNDTLFLNPAGMSLYPRYVLETFWRHQSGPVANLFTLSLVDSKSGPVAGGLAFTYEWVGEGGSVRAGTRLDMASSYMLAKFLLFGVSMHYHGLKTEEGRVRRVTGDFGFLILPLPFLTIALTGQNVLNPVEETAAAPRLFGGGIDLRFIPELNLSFDWTKSVEREGKPAIYRFGVELLVSRSVPLRAGYVSDEVLGEKRWSVGVGYAAQSFSVDLAYSRTIEEGERLQIFSLAFALHL